MYIYASLTYCTDYHRRAIITYYTNVIFNTDCCNELFIATLQDELKV